MADANAIYLSPKPYYLLLINTLRIMLSSLLFTTHRLSLFFYFCTHFGFHHIFHVFMADANAIYLSPKSYYLLLINTLRIISSSLLFTTHHHSLFLFCLLFCFLFFGFFLLPHTSLLMADANAMYHPSFIIHYSSTHYLFTYYFLINPFFSHLGWLMLTSFSS